jgi:hypothetical protein
MTRDDALKKARDFLAQAFCSYDDIVAAGGTIPPNRSFEVHIANLIQDYEQKLEIAREALMMMADAENRPYTLESFRIVSRQALEKLK